MKINCGGIPLRDLASFTDLRASIESDCKRLEELEHELNGLVREAAMEGIILDTLKTTKDVAVGVRDAGKSTYKGINTAYKKGKNKWITYYKPLIVKVIKNMGAVLQSMFAKFNKLGSRYTELGKQIKQVLDHDIKQVGILPEGVGIAVHDFEPNVLKGYINIMADYGNFYTALIETLVDDFMTPDKVISAMNSGRYSQIEDMNKNMSESLGSINKYGELTIPWYIFKSNRFAAMFKALVKWKPSNDELKGSLPDFVKKTILGKEQRYEFKVDQGGRLQNVAKGYLTIVGSIVNNKVLEETLDKGGRSIKSATKEIIEDLDKIEAAKPKEEEKEEKSKENTKDPNEKVDIGSRSTQIVETYINNTNSYITKTSTAYTGITRGVLSAMFEIIAESEFLIKVIRDSAGVKNK